jgi:hypothetical protein
VADQHKWPPSRAEPVMEVEAELLRQYAEPERVDPPCARDASFFWYRMHFRWA